MPRRAIVNPGPPSARALLRGSAAFEKREKRDAMYKTASFLVCHFWGKHTEMAEGLGVLVVHWNHAFYRYGLFDYDCLQDCLAENQETLEAFRRRDILGYQQENDDPAIELLFHKFLDALAIRNGSSKGRSSPVAVAKALHLLAPNFFPLWDEKIARAYGHRYGKRPAEKYMAFMLDTKRIAERLAEHVPLAGKTLLKLIDEYNYARHTKAWIK